MKATMKVKGKDMRWYLFLIFCLLTIITIACVRLSAAPAPPGIPPKEITTEALADYVVVSSDGKEIGPVDGVTINTKTRNTQYIIVFIKDIYNFGKGAINGPQDRYMPIPWSRMKLDPANHQLVVDADAAFIEGAPLLKDSPDAPADGWDVAVEEYWRE
jgi:sporulation protein YlmC with PRC-barrel domain